MQHIYVNILLFVASHIDEDGYSMAIDYGPERQRWKSVLTYDDGEAVETIRSVRYHDDKEIIEEEGKYYSITYLDYDVICLKDLQTSQMTLYQVCTDLLGNVTRIVKGDRSEVFKASYDEWGRQTVTTNTIGFVRGYTGHEMLPEFGLVNMNGRMYDPLLGRFLSADDYVQMPESPQGFNRYAYCLNNPMKYTDPSGEMAWFVPILTGAIIGAGSSALTYAISAGLNKSFKWSGFFKSMGMGALGGAISGALGSVSMTTALGKFSNSLGFNLLGQASSSVITNVVFGNKISFRDVLSSFAGAFAGTAIPKYNATSTSLIRNTTGEIIHNTIRGIATGFMSGAVGGAIYDDTRRVYQGIIGGALSGFSKTLMLDISLGIPIKYEQNIHDTIGKGTYRSGGLFKLITSKMIGGITLGNNMLAYDGEEPTKLHEWYHVFQQYKSGLSIFYPQILLEYSKAYRLAESPYTTPGYLDYEAEQFRIKYTR